MAFLGLQICRKCSSSLLQTVPRAPRLHPQIATSFWEKDRKGGYDSGIKEPPKIEVIKHNLKTLPGEFSKFKSEWQTKLRCDSVFPQEHGDYEIVWKFDNKDTLDDFVVTTDKDHSEGKSSAEFVLSQNKTGIFRGFVNTEVPKDGITKNAGYCNIRSPHKMRSFHRKIPYDWEWFTHLVVRTRGDGRSYQIVLGMDRIYDINWNDQYNYALFTRGGPYWQTAKIPFSKFYLGAKGRIQDKQEYLQRHKISYLGITIADDITGPFQLEIEYIGLVYDENHNNVFHYEMYETRPENIY